MNKSSYKKTMINPSNASTIAFFLGIISILCSLYIGHKYFNSSINNLEQEYHKFYLREAKILGQAAESNKSTDEKVVLNDIQKLWDSIEGKPEDEYICVIDNNSNLILHTAHPETIGNFAGNNLITSKNDMTETCLADLVKSKRDYVGDYISSSGHNQIAAFSVVSGKNWVVGVHRSKKELIKNIEDGIKYSKIGFFLISGILMPLFLIIVFLTFHVAERNRKKTEEKLRRSEKISLTWLESSPISTKMVDLDFNLQYMSAAGANGLKIDNIKQFYGKPYPFDFYPASFRNLMIGNLEKVKATGKIIEQEGVVVDIDGNKLWFHSTLVPVNDGEGQIDYILVVSADITKQKQVEEALRESENFLNRTGEMAKVGGWQLNLETKKVIWTKTTGKIHELPDGYIPVLDEAINFYHPDDRETVSESVNQAIESGKAYDFEVRLITAKGRQRWVRAIGQPIITAGKCVRLSGTFQDITERKQIEEERDRILNLSIDLICVTGMDGYFKYLNPAWEKTLGYTTEELLAQPFLDFIHPDDWVKTENEVKNILANKKTKNFENRNIAKDGSIHVISWSAISLASEGLIYCIGRDITSLKAAVTENKKLESKLQQAQKMEAIGTLASGIAHDFNNILSSILGFAELVKQDLFEHDSELRSNIDQVITAGHRATDLVQHILTFSRYSDIDKKPILITPLIKETINFLRASLSASIEIKTKILHKDATVLGDTTQLHQIMMNLCTNAAHAMKEEGGILTINLEKVSLTAQDISEHEAMKSGDYSKLTISDTGHGIPNKFIDRIFDPFFTTKNRGEGSGMGLSVVYGIIKEMGGAITVRSEPGRGAAFHIIMPVHKTKPLYDNNTHEKELQKGEGHILFVDDEKSILRMSDEILKRAGYKVTTQSNSLNALELIKSNSKAFDIVITDLDMPKMDGIELSTEILKERPGMPIILCTGFSGKVTPQILDKIGIYKVFMKPIIMSKLVETINSAIKLNQ